MSKPKEKGERRGRPRVKDKVERYQICCRPSQIAEVRKAVRYIRIKMGDKFND